MKKKLGAVGAFLTRLEKIPYMVSLVLLLAMMLLGFFDVFLRYLFNSPITGGKETQTVMLPVIVAFALAYTQFSGAHIRVELFYDKFPPRLKKVADAIALLPTLVVWTLIAWQSVVAGNHYFETGRVVNMIHLNLGWVQYAAAVGSALLCLELIRQIFRLFVAAEKQDDQGSRDSIEVSEERAVAEGGEA